MIEATYKMNESDKQIIVDFQKKIINEYASFLKTIERYTKQELIENANKIAFFQCMRDYLVDNFDLSLRQICELSQQYNLLNECYKAYKKDGCDQFGFFEYDAMDILKLTMKDDNF